ncbi:S-adenosyl-L-methionine-dependent methyltransferase [Aspergillus venezuelensis]
MDDYVTNQVAMQGKGSYNSNSALQWAAMMEALPLFDSELQSCNGALTIIEYGASQGANSITPVKHILTQATSSKHPEAPLIATLHFCDRPANDFSALAQTISSTRWPPSTEVFPAMIPRSFFEPILPPQSVDIGFSLAALHHLNRVPARLSGSPEPEERRAVFAAQAKQDLHDFLQLRAREFKTSAPLVLTFVGSSSTGVQNYAPLVEACKIAMGGMIGEGVLSSSVLEVFEVLVYDRSIAEVREVLESEEERGLWSVEECRETMVRHPAVDALGDQEDGKNTSRLSSEEYARVVVKWEMAVIGGYFTSALENALAVDGTEQERLMGLWTERTVDVFLERFRDAVVECCFVLVKLRRI